MVLSTVLINKILNKNVLCFVAISVEKYKDISESKSFEEDQDTVNCFCTSYVNISDIVIFNYVVMIITQNLIIDINYYLPIIR